MDVVAEHLLHAFDWDVDGDQKVLSSLCHCYTHSYPLLHPIWGMEDGLPPDVTEK